ncbi:hypothetical protein GTO91_06715 [Heliobacterium undosum]|uniref:C-type lectin domain-containing protein n=1 Tax=Heliomicrobium undosum TaxID=121734 RepID=A0A845L304_9FIRM|nr:C-type lectin domain-containing protein [Heliomicrobium undosum]MZP29395.1 hypothetical protein [Heliomicrobium undosum]
MNNLLKSWKSRALASAVMIASLILPNAAFAVDRAQPLPKAPLQTQDINFFGWVTGKVAVDPFGGHTYGLFDDDINVAHAKSIAESLGGHLARIDSAQEQDFIHTLMQKGNKNFYWLGALGRTPGMNNAFFWLPANSYPAATIDYADWAPGEPNDRGGEDFIAISKENSQWYDLFGRQNELRDSGQTKFGYIVEWEFTYRPSVEQPSVRDNLNGSPTFAHTYFLYDISRDTDFPMDGNNNFAQAQQFAVAKGGYLATIQSEHERNITKFLLALGKRSAYWLGATDRLNGTWNWINPNGTLGAAFGPWEANYFINDDQGGEHYLQVLNNRKSPDTIGLWNDAYGGYSNNVGLIVERNELR